VFNQKEQEREKKIVFVSVNGDFFDSDAFSDS